MQSSLSASLADLVRGMRTCEQAPGLSVLAHGIAVRDRYAALLAHLRHGRPLPGTWKLPSWIGDSRLLQGLPPDEVMACYHVMHDCGKPACLVVDEQGRRHFPDHARVSERLWLDADGDPRVGRLIGMDMDVHLLRPEGVAAFAQRPEAGALLLTGVSEVHANAAMFGGFASESCKIKLKHLERRGRHVLAAMPPGDEALIARAGGGA